MFTTIQDALDQIQNFGLDVHAPIVDGRVKKCRYNDERNTSKSGYYKLREIYRDGEVLVDGFYGSFRVSEKSNQIKRNANLGLDADKFAKIKAQYRERSIEQARQEREQHQLSAERAAFIWDESQETGDSPYLKRKQIEPFGVRFSGSSIIVPMGKEGRMTSLQCIAASGKKKYLFGGDIKGAYYLIKGSSKVALVEGFATGATVHMATGWTVAVCFSGGGLVSAAPYFKKKDVVICADNDEATDKRIGTNPGVKFGKRAGDELGCKVYICRNQGDLGVTDFNDAHVKHGLDYVRRELDV